MESYVGCTCDLDSRVLGAQVKGCDKVFLVCSCLIGTWRSESWLEYMVGSVKSCRDEYHYR